jgi:hypothetical protein
MGYQDGLVHQDLFDPIPGLKRSYGAVVADPPWYPEFHRAFILRASEALQEDGVLLLSALPWLTRPNADADRAGMLEFAMRAGFDLAEVAPGVLGYQSPKFEQAALSMKGIHCGEWRTGDLYVFRRVRQADPSLTASRPDDEPEWDEYVLSHRKVKLRRRSDRGGQRFSVRPAAKEGPVLAEVSRRSTVRRKIDLWTSDNVAYSIRGLRVARKALAKLEAGESPSGIAAGLVKVGVISAQEATVLTGLLAELIMNGTP